MNSAEWELFVPEAKMGHTRNEELKVVVFFGFFFTFFSLKKKGGGEREKKIIGSRQRWLC